MGSPGATETFEEFALSLPEARPDTPWGDRVVKVGTKIVLLVSSPESERPVLTVKVPDSRDHALSYPEAPRVRRSGWQYGCCLLGRGTGLGGLR